MSGAQPFLDTSVLLYLLSSDSAKADRAEALLVGGAVVSLQVLNEFVAVARRKLSMDWEEIAEVLGVIRRVVRIEPLTLETHDSAVHCAQRYGFAWYDALVVAAALIAGCAVLYTEDLRDGLAIEQRLVVRNPFGAYQR